MSVILTSLRRLRSSPRLHHLPPYLSLLCIVGGIFWLFLLPLQRYSRQTYISENALLPGQVHTYFAGSEQNVFRAYREELRLAESLSNGTPTENLTTGWVGAASEIFENAGLPVASQSYRYESAGVIREGTNVYSVLQAPRGDGTEAIILVAPKSNAAGEDNGNGVALLLTLARYFKRWSLWSKDIILLLTPDTNSGPQAWISAYHSTQDSQMVEFLPLKSGAIQGAVCIDLPVDHRFEKLAVSYDGLNGQLPNLDLVNIAIGIASGQMGMGVTIHGIDNKQSSYWAGLSTMLRGMASQAEGWGTGAHAVFMPFHIDAVTLTATGRGRHDEMTLGRTVESMVRSLNNLLEHFHQSFFFYLLLQTNRFVSIGTYLPSAMAVASGFSLMSFTLWIRSGLCQDTLYSVPKGDEGDDNTSLRDRGEKKSAEVDSQAKTTQPPDRPLLKPISIILAAHLSSVVPIFLSTHICPKILSKFAPYLALSLLALPALCSLFVAKMEPPSFTVTQSLSLLLLGLYLSTLATLNFSLSLLLGLLSAPILLFYCLFDMKAKEQYGSKNFPSVLVHRVNLSLSSPPAIWLFLTVYSNFYLSDPEWSASALEAVAFGWNVLGVWGPLLGVWAIWWPAWAVAYLLSWSSPVRS